ncbi:1,4-dihydroxy-2-naphthoate polyprenyltransferase [Dysgonomonas sp. 25]|uniref:1,4-dihydroxy-2-naphthoate polyprenyltransferase n=1 Tax=Dysgonomonas sp. 25 TaxID=2302933 RepID=UPI0013D802EA|nr:1,4-dihydroxy-2-naphthoate polyprenyltransferase [Dysgonomonas sp. 25]NDV69716.1 1,4-dihydroxy-2-naphthoate polyprenyltransferase [Dysgonomonas sp. 25]
MAFINAWISAARPRTLFLAVGTAICGSGLAYYTGHFSVRVFILTLLTASVLQILSNFANDLGDFQHGTDTTGERVGPKRAVQSGAITEQEMKRAVLVAAILSAIVGLLLVYIALQFINIIYIVVFILLGLLAIVAAVKYTAGKNPYGYKGLGDVFSFIFFGPVPVVGTYFLHTQQLDFVPWLPAIALGFLSAAVLNTNNMRDLENDRKSGKITIPVRLGIKGAKAYHAFLLLGAIACFVLFNILYTSHWWQYLYVLVFLLLIAILAKVLNTQENARLDPYLKFTSMSAFLLSLAFVISINV